MRLDAADIAVQRQAARFGGRLTDSRGPAFVLALALAGGAATTAVEAAAPTA